MSVDTETFKRKVEMSCGLCSSNDDSCIGTKNEYVQVPSSFFCPITGEVMVDPMIIVGSKQTVSRAAARQWFSMGHFRCPVTNINLNSIRMIPNRSLCAAIKEFNESGNNAMQKSFICPVTGKVMRDSVVIIQSMVTVSRSAALEWQCSDEPACPVTGKILKNREVITNFALNGAIEEWDRLGWGMPRQGTTGMQYYRKQEDEDDLSTFEKYSDSKYYDQDKEDKGKACWCIIAFATLAVCATKWKSFNLVKKSISLPQVDLARDGLVRESNNIESRLHEKVQKDSQKQAEQCEIVQNEFPISSVTSRINEAEDLTAQTSQAHSHSFLSLLQKDPYMISSTSFKEGSTQSASSSSVFAGKWDFFVAAFMILLQYLEFSGRNHIH